MEYMINMQGRGKKQMENNYKLTFWSFVGLILMFIIICITS